MPKLRLGGIVKKLLIIPLLLAVGRVSLSSALEVPRLQGRVNDLASMLPSDREQELDDRLAAFERETGHQIAVLTIPSLQGDAVEDFSIRVAERWKIGQKGFDNGAILLIVRDDRKLRIEVGYGLEGILPDAIASQIIRKVIVPRFRDNDYAGGIEAGISAIMHLTRGEALPKPVRKRQRAAHSGPFSIIGLLIATVLLALMMGITWQSASGAAVGGAILSALIGLPAMTVGIGRWASIVIFGSLAAALANYYIRRSWGRAWSVKGDRHYDYSPRDVLSDGSAGLRGGGRFGGGGGGFGGSGGSGSGGFSGGGGGFGGGGASGGW